jgi:hypothetical protein
MMMSMVRIPPSQTCFAIRNTLVSYKNVRTALLCVNNAPSSGSFLPTFRDNVSFPSSEFKNPNKACSPRTQFIYGGVWAVKSLISLVSADRVDESCLDVGGAVVGIETVYMILER